MSRMRIALSLVCCCAWTAWAFAQSEGAAPAASSSVQPFEGEVTGDNVYVRSGPGTHWYPTAKLSKGARVRVVSEEYGWYRIVPPAGSFSYVDAAAIERSAGGNTGVTRVAGVYVKAGSELSDRKIATQQILPQGAEVSIVGEAEGFLKIVPPEGSYLYMSKLYVRPAGAGHTEPVAVTEEPAASVNVVAPPPATDESRPAVASRDDAALPNVPVERASAPPPAAPPPSPARQKYRAMLDSVEADLQAQLAASDRTPDFSAFISRFQPLADQSEDLVAQAVARARLDQLRAYADLQQIVGSAQTTRVEIEGYRTQLQRDRDILKNSPLPPALRPWDYKGELRRSAAFENREWRYRLVEPQTEKTLAYIDFPPSNNVDPRRFVNRYVGIRISGQQFSPSARVPIAVAIEAEALPPPVGTSSSPPLPPVAATNPPPELRAPIATAPRPSTPPPAAATPAPRTGLSSESMWSPADAQPNEPSPRVMVSDSPAAASAMDEPPPLTGDEEMIPATSLGQQSGYDPGA